MTSRLDADNPTRTYTVEELKARGFDDATSPMTLLKYDSEIPLLGKDFKGLSEYIDPLTGAIVIREVTIDGRTAELVFDYEGGNAFAGVDDQIPLI